MSRKRHPPAGARPGTLMISPQAQAPKIHVMKYGPDHLEEHDVSDVTRLRSLLSEDSVCWIDVQGLGDEQVLRSLGDVFQIHPLALEDAVNMPQRPKIESYDQHMFCITRMAMSGTPGTVITEQVSMFIGRNYVLMFQERSGDVFDPIRNRIRQGGPVFRASGPGYLAYALLDAVIDGYFPIMEDFGEHLEWLEGDLIADPRPETVQQVHRVKRELLTIRRAIWPQREVANSLIRDENPFFSDTARIYLRDCYDHCVQIIDVVETYREIAAGLMDVYLSSVSNRQNEVMKVLTIMASIFIPLTLLTGIFGMNFHYMPGLGLVWGYPAVLASMLVVAVSMTFYFRHKGWIGGQRRREPGPASRSQSAQAAPSQPAAESRDAPRRQAGG